VDTDIVRIQRDEKKPFEGPTSTDGCPKDPGLESVIEGSGVISLYLEKLQKLQQDQWETVDPKEYYLFAFGAGQITGPVLLSSIL
jgi:hypothetical protein